MKKHSSDKSGIIEESCHWVLNNAGYKLPEGSGFYSSPRLSSEVMDCSMPMTFDHFNYCSLGCLYCFAYFFKSNNPSVKDKGLRPVAVDKMIKALEGNPIDSGGRLMHKFFYSKKFLLHWGGLADPFCLFEKNNRVGYRLLEALGELNYPTLFSFKGNTIFERDYLALFDKYSKQRNFAFQVSIITADDALAREVEIGVPPPTRRIEAIRLLSQMGYFTILRLRPFIIGISDASLEDLLYKALEAGIKGISMEFFALDVRSNLGMKERYAWLAKLMGIKDMHDYFKALSPKERGGYMRLNRLVKESHVKTVYKFCIENGLVFGCSDPDFKELNTSGSCCAMPDKYPANEGLTNWTHNQLTYHLKEARRAFHKTGETIKLTFSEVYRSDADYLDDVDMINYHVSVTGMCNAERYANTYRTIIQRHWNNLRSPANPRNYFHGKLMPCGLDAEGNLVYKYNPMEYEERWKVEGIDLTK